MIPTIILVNIHHLIDLRGEGKGSVLMKRTFRIYSLSNFQIYSLVNCSHPAVKVLILIQHCYLYLLIKN